MSQQKRKRKRTGSASPVDSAPPTASAGATDWSAVFALALLAASVWAVYGRAVDAPFVFDDRGNIVDNSLLRNPWHLFGDTENPGLFNPPPSSSVAGRPLVNISLALNYQLSQLRPAGYHALNFCLHALSAWLLFLVVRRVLGLPYFAGRFERVRGLLALLITMLWALHPLQTEAVIYVSQRTELMVGFCLLATLYCALRYWDARSRGAQSFWLTLAVLACAAGMASKEVMVSAPLIVLLLDRAFVSGSLLKACRQSRPLYLGLACGWIVLLMLNHSGPRSNTAGFHLGIPAYVWWFTQAKVLLMYLKLVLWPWPLAIHYEMDYVDTFVAAWPWLLPVALLVTGVLILLWRNHPVGFLGACVLLILSPTSLVPIITEVAAERRMYLPLAALLVLLIVGGYVLAQRLADRQDNERRMHDSHRRLLAAAACGYLAVILVASVVSARRAEVYNDEVGLWQATVAVQPNDPTAHYNLGLELAKRGRWHEAMESYRRAIELNPDFYQAYTNLGSLLVDEGQSGAAIEQFEQALRIKPDHVTAHFNLGNVQASLGQTDAAIYHYEQALLYEPDYAAAHYNLANTLKTAGRAEEALSHYAEAVRLEPNARHFRNNYGIALRDLKRYPEAVEQFQQALRIEPTMDSARANLAATFAAMGRYDQALELYDQLAGLHAGDPAVYVNRGNLLLAAGRFSEAVEQFQQSLRLDPNNIRAYVSLADAYARLDRPAEVIAATQKAAALARSAGQTALAERIDAWLADYRSQPSDAAHVAPITDDTPE